MANSDMNYTQRPMEKWLEGYHSDSLALPKFQRSYVWDNTKIKDLLQALLLGRPIGTLLLIPDDSQRFASRPMRGVHEKGKRSDNVELVLDGQQRLASLWGAFRGDPEVFVVKVRCWSEVPLELVEICTLGDVGIQRSGCVSPVILYEKKSFPFNILGIDGVTQDDDAAWRWCNAALKNNGEEARKILNKINKDFGEPLRNRGLWHLTLPAHMSADQAIDIYVKTNQSSAIIRKFDLAVARYYSMTGKSLRDEIIAMIKQPNEETALIRRFFTDVDEDDLIPKLGELRLKVACLWADLPPTEGNYTELSALHALEDDTNDFRAALVWSLDCYTKEGIEISGHVPSDVPLRVLPALYPVVSQIPRRYDAKAKRLVRAYLWHSFLTDRYSRSANTQLYDDYKHLRKALKKPESLSNEPKDLAPIFDNGQFPLPSFDELADLDEPLAPPKRKNMRSRAIFALSLQGARDFATGEVWRGDAKASWNYHHLFPKDYLKKNGIEAKRSNHCLNFALITEKTNGVIRQKPPHEYLASGSDLVHLRSGHVSELRELVRSHRIPFEELACEPTEHQDVEGIYRSFIKVRARLMADAIDKLAYGATAQSI